MKVEELGLTGMALAAAQEFSDDFPDADYTSGRRGLEAQAHAVAEDVLLDRDFVKNTYREGVVKDAVQAWIENATQPLTQDRLAAGILAVLQTFSDDDLAHFSIHLSGEAFDVRPVFTPRGLLMKARLYELATIYGGKFLEHEGKLIRWHWQAKA